MIKFVGQDGVQSMTMKDDGELDFATKQIKDEYDKAEKEVNKIEDK